MTFSRRPNGRRRNDGRIGVAYLTPTLAPGGAERQMLLLASALPEAEFAVRFLVLSELGAWAPEARQLGVPVDLLGVDRTAFLRRDPRFATSMLRALRAYVRATRRVDIVDAWHVPSFTFAATAQPFARVPVLLAGRRSTTDLYANKPALQRVAGALASRAVDAVVANSAVAARQAVEREGIPDHKVHIIRNAVLPIERDLEARRRYRDGWGFGPDDLVVGCVANYKPGKGQMDLLVAMAWLRDRLPNVRLVLVGDGPDRDELERAIGQMGLARSALLVGRIAEARNVYGAFDVAVQASHSEGLPNTILEAAAARLPIVATDVGGTREIVADGASALLVPAGDPPALGAALERLALDGDLRERLAEAARHGVDAFSVARLAGSTAALYRELIDGSQQA
jgi:glycosyltransferase involved in cell wall biosynthesis